MNKPTLASRDRLVETPTGTLFVREIAGDDPPIVLMHGFPDDHHGYDLLLPLLSRDGRLPLIGTAMAAPSAPDSAGSL